ncbi:hypothetical protein EMCRGX_G010872 [Ephydatia muelleri]
MEFKTGPLGVDPIFGPIYVPGNSWYVMQYYTRKYVGASRLQHTERNLKRGRVIENNCKSLSGLGPATLGVNEAFAAQYLAVEKDLGLDRAKNNVNGGAIALVHPLAASGSGITAHLVQEMKRRNAKYSIGSACIGGGQGIAILCALIGGII